MLTDHAKIILLLLAAAAFLVGCAPEAPRTPVPPQEITIFTQNLHAEGRIVQPLGDVIRAVNADIVALQEVSSGAAQLFDAQLRDLYPHQIAVMGRDRYAGMAVLSRFPIRDDHSWLPDQRLLRVELDVNGARLMVYNAHPASPGSTQMDTTRRSADIAFMLEQVAQATMPVLLVGDMNSEPWSDDYARITAVYADAFAAVGAGTGFTYPDYSQPQARINARFPSFTPLLVRLDYIFYGDAFTPLAAEVGSSSGGSDHLPVMATLRLAGQ